MYDSFDNTYQVTRMYANVYFQLFRNLRCQRCIHYNTRTKPFNGSLDFLRDNPGEPVPEEVHLLNFLVQNEDNTGRRANNPDGLPPLD